MKIKSIEWRNIGSFGNKIQRLDFSEDGELWQLYGRVGRGKSTILSLPILAFYGKNKDTKVGDIANRINKNGWIKVEVEVGNVNYIIERGFSPSSLSIIKNGENIDRARDMQSIIDNEIVGLPYHIFTNILSLSLNSFKSFINMTPNDKRQIIDKIFSLEIINKIYEFIKKDLKELGQAINSLDNQIYSFEQTITQSKKELDKLKNNKDLDIDNKLISYNNLLTEIDKQLTTNITSYNEHISKLQEAETSVNNFRLLYNNINNEIKNINEKINLFNQHKCPTCGNNFDTDEFESIKDNLKKEINEKTEILNMHKNNIDAYNDYISKLKNNISILTQNNSSLQINKSSILNEIKRLKSDAKNENEFEAINNIIKNAEENKFILEKNKNEYNKNVNYLQILNSIYDAEGIKKTIMSNYIPTLNEEIKTALINLSFPYLLEFDDNFNAHLKYLGEDIPISSLSTGETKNVDLAVLISMIKIIKRKYPQINLICLDETVSSIDPESCIDIIKLLKDIAEDLQLNMLIVSHVQLPVEYFNKRLEIYKNIGFSDINIID